MASKDKNFGMKLSHLLAAVIASNTTTAGAVVDMNGDNDFEALEVALAIGAHTDGSYSILLEESDDNISFNAVAAESILGDNTALDAANSVSHVGYVGKKRYVRASVVSTDVTTGANATLLAMQDCPRSAPLN